MDTEITIRIGDKEKKNGVSHWSLTRLVQKTTVLTGSRAPSLEDAIDMFASAYQDALADLAHQYTNV